MEDPERLQAIIEFQAGVAGARLDLEAVMRLVAQRAQELTRATAGVVELAEGDDMVYAAATGAAREHLGTRLGRATSLSGMCVALNEVLRCDDAETDPRVDGEAVRRIGIDSMVCVPLIHEGVPVGVLKVMSDVKAAFDDDDVETLRILSGVIAAQMSHATSFAQIAHESRHDGLTQVANRRAYDERLRSEVSRAVRYGRPLSLLLADVDRFKPINDRLGHAEGDAVLRGVAAAIVETVRVADDVFRIGGDEFAVILPDTPAPRALAAAERVIAGVRAARLAGGVATVSVGAAELTGTEPEELHEAADRALYESKAGRDDVAGPV
jgi:diguanylate cyclase